MKTMAETRTAAEAYAAHRKDIAALLRLILEQVDVHAAAAAKDSNDWGYTGTLGHARHLLKEVLVFLMGAKQEKEASEQVERHLAEMRNQ